MPCASTVHGSHLNFGFDCPGRDEIRPAADMGPIICCLDTSGSMYGARETVAKARLLPSPAPVTETVDLINMHVTCTKEGLNWVGVCKEN